MEAPLADEADVKEGETLEIDFFGRPAILVRVGGEIHAYINCCTHTGGPVKLDGDILHCQWHGSDFDAATGEALTPPAPTGSKLIKLPIKVRGGKVFYVYP